MLHYKELKKVTAIASGYKFGAVARRGCCTCIVAPESGRLLSANAT